MGKRRDIKSILDQFPHINTLNWEKAFREDTELYARVWRDILKNDQTYGTGRPGPRPALDTRRAQMRYIQLNDEDYSIELFPEALRTISKNATVRSIAAKTGLNRNIVQRLLAGEKPPDQYEMEICAVAYDRHAAYFLEYRIGYVLQMVHTHMVKYPESSISPYRKVRDSLGQNHG